MKLPFFSSKLLVLVLLLLLQLYLVTVDVHSFFGTFSFLSHLAKSLNLFPNFSHNHGHCFHHFTQENSLWHEEKKQLAKHKGFSVHTATKQTNAMVIIAFHWLRTTNKKAKGCWTSKLEIDFGTIWAYFGILCFDIFSKVPDHLHFASASSALGTTNSFRNCISSAAFASFPSFWVFFPGFLSSSLFISVRYFRTLYALTRIMT